jgi:hypothetical protein
MKRPKPWGIYLFLLALAFFLQSCGSGDNENPSAVPVTPKMLWQKCVPDETVQCDVWRSKGSLPFFIIGSIHDSTILQWAKYRIPLNRIYLIINHKARARDFLTLALFGAIGKPTGRA